MLLPMTINTQRKSLGYSTDEIEAPNAYDRPANNYRGQYPVLNLPANFGRRERKTPLVHLYRFCPGLDSYRPADRKGDCSGDGTFLHAWLPQMFEDAALNQVRGSFLKNSLGKLICSIRL